MRLLLSLIEYCLKKNFSVFIGLVCALTLHEEFIANARELHITLYFSPLNFFLYCFFLLFYFLDQRYYVLVHLFIFFQFSIDRYKKYPFHMWWSICQFGEDHFRKVMFFFLFLRFFPFHLGFRGSGVSCKYFSSSSTFAIILKLLSNCIFIFSEGKILPLALELLFELTCRVVE